MFSSGSPVYCKVVPAADIPCLFQKKQRLRRKAGCLSPAHHHITIVVCRAHGIRRDVRRESYLERGCNFETDLLYVTNNGFHPCCVCFLKQGPARNLPSRLNRAQPSSTAQVLVPQTQQARSGKTCIARDALNSLVDPGDQVGRCRYRSWCLEDQCWFP